MTTKERALKLYQEGLRISEIARVLRLRYATVYNWCVRRAEQQKERRNEKAVERYCEILGKSSVGQELKRWVSSVFHQKGEERVLSLHQFWKLKKEELERAGIKVSKSRFYEIARQYVYHEFGSVSNLEKARRHKTAHQYVAKQGSISRERGLWEMDASGWKDEITGKSYSFMVMMDTYSGYLVDFTWVENKEGEAKHYNKAFDSLQVGRFLMQAFAEYGVPRMLRTDNEKVLTSEYLKGALKELGVRSKKIPPRMPHLKLIERAIGSLKGYLKSILQADPSLPFGEAMKEAIRRYNREMHNFKHGVIRPIEHFEPGRKVSEEELKYGFAEKIERVLRDNVIQIDSQKYQLDVISERLGETGRLEKGIPVLCVRYLDDVSKIEVFDRETGEFLGTAKLVSLITLRPLSTIEAKELEGKQRRAERRLAKIEKEATEIKGQIQPEGILKVLSGKNGENGEDEPQRESFPLEEECNGAGSIGLLKILTA